MILGNYNCMNHDFQEICWNIKQKMLSMFYFVGVSIGYTITGNKCIYKFRSEQADVKHK
jgi:hypothetical protein